MPLIGLLVPRNARPTPPKSSLIANLHVLIRKMAQSSYQHGSEVADVVATVEMSGFSIDQLNMASSPLSISTLTDSCSNYD